MNCQLFWISVSERHSYQPGHTNTCCHRIVDGRIFEACYKSDIVPRSISIKNTHLYLEFFFIQESTHRWSKNSHKTEENCWKRTTVLQVISTWKNKIYTTEIWSEYMYMYCWHVKAYLIYQYDTKKLQQDVV